MNKKSDLNHNVNERTITILTQEINTYFLQFLAPVVGLKLFKTNKM